MCIFGKRYSDINIDNADVISFDVFGTLVMRKNDEPSDVFDNVIDDPDFKGLRIKAEQLARKKRNKEDVTIEDIYYYLPGYSIQKEIDAEIKDLTVNAFSQAFYNQCIGNGKKVIIMSDMYYKKEVIGMMLENMGYNTANVDIYVSAEYGVAKKTGNLFKVVLARNNLTPTNMVHIGDSFFADYLRPRLLGIKGYLISE